MGPRPPESQSGLEPLTDLYREISSEVQKIEVNRAASVLENTIIGLRSDTPSRARVAALLAAVSPGNFVV